MPNTKKKINSNSLIGKVYEQTGIDQLSLSTFLCVNQYTLSRYTAGTRSLQTEPLVQLSKLFTMLGRLPQETISAPNEKEKKQLLEAAAWCRLQCKQIQKKLVAMQRCQKQASTMIKLLEVCGTATSLAATKKQRWMDEQLYRAEKKLSKNGWLPQQKLSVQITLLIQEAELYEASVA